MTFTHSAILTTLLGLTLHAGLYAESVPQVISYQGRLSNASGIPLGQSAPISRKMLFRLYDASTGGTLKWSEQQLVTVSAGSFSILLGNGTAFGSDPHDPLDKVFGSGSTQLFLELKVDDGDSIIDAADPAILPRQQIATSGFSFRANSIESITPGTDLRFLPQGSTAEGNYGIGYYGGTRSFAGVALDGPALYGANGGALGVVNGSNSQIALNWLANGNVGIGVSSPTERLDVAGSIKASGTLEVGANTAAAGLVKSVGAATAASLAATGPISGGTLSGTSLTIRSATDNAELASISDIGAIRIRYGGDLNGPTGNELNITSEGKIKIHELTITNSVSANTGSTPANVLNAQKRLVLGANLLGWGDSVSSTVGAPSEGANATTGMRLILRGNNASTDLVGFGLATGTRLFSIAPPTGKTEWYGGTTKHLSLDHETALLTTKKMSIEHPTRPALLKIEASNLARLELNQTTASASDTNSIVLSNRSDGTADLAWLRSDGTSLTRIMSFRRSTTDPQLADQVGDVGYVGINTTNPKAPLHVVSPAAYDDANANIAGLTGAASNEVGVRLGNDGGVAGAGATYTYVDGHTIKYARIAAIFEGNIVSRRTWFGTGLDTNSDRRAKNILGLTDNTEDLANLMKLKVTDYRWIDRTVDQHMPHKRLIAQEAQEVFPQAISTSALPQVIPNVYELATHLKHDAEQGILTITTRKPHDFKKGDVVDLIGDRQNMRGITVKDALDAHRFSIDCKTAPKSLFVFGKQVNDFRTVDYDAISMLNLSATQALKKQNDDLAAANKELRDQLGDQEKRRKALERTRQATDAKFAALEALLQQQSRPQATPAALKR